MDEFFISVEPNITYGTTSRISLADSPQCPYLEGPLSEEQARFRIGELVEQDTFPGMLDKTTLQPSPNEWLVSKTIRMGFGPTPLIRVTRITLNQKV